MKDLSTANERIGQIAKDYPAISPITPDDYPLFHEYFAREPHSYGNSWTYITQGMYGIGPNKLGYKYYDGTNLSAVCVYPKIEDPETLVFYWVRPMGPTILETINEISQGILSKKKTPTYVKKLFKNQFDTLREFGFRDIREFPWHTLYPAEDDTLPEQIIDLKYTIETAKTKHTDKRLGSAYRYYQSYVDDDTITFDSLTKHHDEALVVLEKFFEYSRSHTEMPIISAPTDYYAMIKGLASHDTTVDKFIYFDNEPIGFYFGEKLTNDTASMYAFITLRELSNHIVDYMIFDAFHSMLNQNIRFLNMGGSENENIHFFKKKFLPVRENPMYWATRF